MSRSEPLTGSVADVCLDLVATPSEYGDEEALADLVEARCRALGVRHERLRHSVVARTGGDGEAIALVGHLDTVPNWPGGVALRDRQQFGGQPAEVLAVQLQLGERVAPVGIKARRYQQQLRPEAIQLGQQRIVPSSSGRHQQP